MDTKIKEYILQQPVDRQSILTDIHFIIMDADKTVVARTHDGERNDDVQSKRHDEVCIVKCKELHVASLSANVWFAGVV